MPTLESTTTNSIDAVVAGAERFRPLDRVHGEPIDDRERNVLGEVVGPGEFYGARYEVVEPDELFRHDIRVEFEVPGKFRSLSRRNVNYRHILDDVITLAGEEFIRHGAIETVRGLRIEEEDILVQVYPELLKVVVVVQRIIGGKQVLVTLIYPPADVWPPQLIKTLLDSAGKKSPTRH